MSGIISTHLAASFIACVQRQVKSARRLPLSGQREVMSYKRTSFRTSEPTEICSSADKKRKKN